MRTILVDWLVEVATEYRYMSLCEFATYWLVFVLWKKEALCIYFIAYARVCSQQTLFVA
jgi:hypothetical protein